MDKKRILIFGMTAQYGGVESFIMNYVRHMDKESFQFDFLSYNSLPAYADEITEMGGKIYVVTGRGKNPFKSAKEIKNILKNGNYDAVWSNLCYLSDISVLKYAKRYNVPIRIIHSHNSVNMSGKINGVLHKINKKTICKYATNFWACSDLAGEFFYTEKIRKGNGYKVIPNAVDTARFTFNAQTREEKRKELKIEDKLVIGNVGRLHFQKNQLFLLEVFKEILKINPNSVLMIVGDGELKDEIANKCNELEISDKVLMLGRRADIPELMNAMDIFVLPSLFEGLGIVLIEAQCSGLPSFTSAKVVPQLAKVTDLLEYIDLSKSSLEWAERILKTTHQNRVDYSSKVMAADYDIGEQAKKLKKFLIH